MKEINQKLDQWIYNSIVRAEVRETIIQMKIKAMDRAYAQGHKMGVEAGLDYNVNTNEDG
jgi:hypothetical protein